MAAGSHETARQQGPRRAAIKTSPPGTDLCKDFVMVDVDAHAQVHLGTDGEQAAALLHLGAGRWMEAEW